MIILSEGEVFMQNYSTTKIAEGFYCITQEFVRCFLFEGEKEALLVDTGVGGNLREYVEEITKLPVTLVVTHSDWDHVAAAEQFDKRLMHPSEFNNYKRNSKVVPMEAIWEGDIIDLGNFRFEVILIPGHTPGSIALLERKKRFLIGGDSIQTGPIFMMGEGRSFEAFRASMKKLQGLLGAFDTIYSSHHEMIVKPEIINQLYTGACKVIEQKAESKQVIINERQCNCYEVDGVAFFGD
jgi:hydroxyacylglutathione hydrolase